MAAKKPRPRKEPETEDSVHTPLRIIGGKLRGRKLNYTGRLGTRPMKHRVREAIFNLVGPQIAGMHAVDLFAGTGAIGLESLSRGAAEATFVEQHFPTAENIRKNIADLGIKAPTTVTGANTFLWARKASMTDALPWVIFCSPPYDFYIDRADDMHNLLNRLQEQAPAGSIAVVESDDRFDFSTLAHADEWDVRTYYPAVVGIRHL